MAYTQAFGAPAAAQTAQSLVAARSPSLGPPGIGPQQPPPPPQTPAPRPITTPTPAPPPAPANTLGQLPAFLRGLTPAQPEFPAGSADPAYLAYLRSLEYQQQTAELAAQQRLQSLQQNMALSGQAIGAQGVISRRGISGAAESRGTFESGQRLQDLADERVAEAQRLAGVRLSSADQYGGIVGSLQQTLASIANQRAEQALAAEVRTA